MLLAGFTAGVGICRALRSGACLGPLPPHVPADPPGAGDSPELLSLVLPSGSLVPRSAASGARVDSGTNTCGVSGTRWGWGAGGKGRVAWGAHSLAIPSG